MGKVIVIKHIYLVKFNTFKEYLKLFIFDIIFLLLLDIYGAVKIKLIVILLQIV